MFGFQKTVTTMRLFSIESFLCMQHVYVTVLSVCCHLHIYSFHASLLCPPSLLYIYTGVPYVTTATLLAEPQIIYHTYLVSCDSSQSPMAVMMTIQLSTQSLFSIASRSSVLTAVTCQLCLYPSHSVCTLYVPQSTLYSILCLPVLLYKLSLL